MTVDVQTSTIPIEMEKNRSRYAPGQVRDGIIQVMSLTSKQLTVKEIQERVSRVVGPTRNSSVRSYLRLNTPETFIREGRGVYALRPATSLGSQRELNLDKKWEPPFSFRAGNAASW